MAELEMASTVKYPYQKLKYSEELDHGFGRERSFGRWRWRLRSSSSWFRFKRVHNRRRFKLKIPSLRKLLRRKSRLISAMRGSVSKVLKRFKDGEGYFSDLFAGNYLFIQVNPNSLRSLQKQYALQNFTPNYSLPRVG